MWVYKLTYREIVGNFNLSERFYQAFYLLPKFSDVVLLQGSYYQFCLMRSNTEEINEYYCHLFSSEAKCCLVSFKRVIGLYITITWNYLA